MTQNPLNQLDLAIVMEGGNVIAVISRDASFVGKTVQIIDYDTEGGGDEDLSDVRQSDGAIADAYVSEQIVEQAEIEVLPDAK